MNNPRSRLERKAEETSIIRVHAHSEGNKKYIPYCNFEIHQGIPKDEEICLKRKCKYLVRLYLPYEKKESVNRLIKHDEIIEDLRKRLLNQGMEVGNRESYILTDNKEIIEKYGLFLNDRNGEVDIYGVDQSRKILVAIEVKENRCGNNDRKVHRQLKKDNLFLRRAFPNFKIKLMHAYGANEHRRGYNVELFSPKL
ncbi:Uncharacterised protein [uncultured archaeon]|nr:Uncharacterised protein [uncultured archaeon]